MVALEKMQVQHPLEVLHLLVVKVLLEVVVMWLPRLQEALVEVVLALLVVMELQAQQVTVVMVERLI